MAIRPEDISVSTTYIPDALQCTAYSVLPAGADTTIVARAGKLEITVKEPGISKIRMDDQIWLRFNAEAINLYAKESGNLISN